MSEFDDRLDEKYNDNLLFYRILKGLIQCHFSYTQLSALQSNVTSQNVKKISDVVLVRNFLLDYSNVLKNSDKYSSFVDFLETLNEYNMSEWLIMVDTAIDLLSIKNLIVDESKIYVKNRHKNRTKGINDKLSVAFDLANLEIPYGERVVSGLLCHAITDTNRDREFLLKSSTEEIKNVQKKLNLLEEVYNVTVNNMFSLILDESMNQSIRSDSGQSYESRVYDSFLPCVDSISGHAHDSRISAVEYDCILTISGHKYGVSAKRTLRERYKQNIDDPANIDVDRIIVVTLGIDLNEDKLKALIQKKAVVVVAEEIYETTEYLKNNKYVLSSADLTKESLLRLLKQK